MHDPDLDETFLLGNFEQNLESKWFDMGSEPIWEGLPKLKALHYSESNRIPEIILEAKKGWVFIKNDSSPTGYLKGMHGYDPAKVPDMYPFFIASGPAFKRGVVVEPFDMVDIYPLMCTGDNANLKSLITFSQRKQRPPQSLNFLTGETTALSQVIDNFLTGETLPYYKSSASFSQGSSRSLLCQLALSVS
ncbi:hypothetical protein ScPMuIL_013235 [Solemya velum]